MKPAPRRWARLVLALALLAWTVALVHVCGSRLPGAPGALIARNKAEDLEVYAYVYSDLGKLRAFLDDALGRYGSVALGRALSRR